MKLSGSHFWIDSFRIQELLKKRSDIQYDKHETLLSDFITSLTDAIAWCTPRVSIDDPENSLRTILLEPLPASRDDQISHIYHSRLSLLSFEKRLPSDWVKDLQRGRLMAYDPDLTTVEGASPIESSRFFDFQDCPPGDTWVLYIHETRDDPADTKITNWSKSYLVAWVPPEFIKLADAGMRVNTTECIVWLDEIESPFTELLRKHNLLNPNLEKS